MVPLVPAARKPLPFLGSFAVREQAEIRFVIMHSMGVPFMAEKGRIGGELSILTAVGRKFTPIRLQVRI